MDSNTNGLAGSTDTLSANPTAKSSSTGGSVPKAIIKNVDMSEEMQQVTVDIALAALNKFTVEKDLAQALKREMDNRFGPTWHAVVGQRFGSFVTHETGHFIYFYLDQIAFLLWRA